MHAGQFILPRRSHAVHCRVPQGSSHSNPFNESRRLCSAVGHTMCRAAYVGRRSPVRVTLASRSSSGPPRRSITKYRTCTRMGIASCIHLTAHRHRSRIRLESSVLVPLLCHPFLLRPTRPGPRRLIRLPFAKPFSLSGLIRAGGTHTHTDSCLNSCFPNSCFTNFVVPDVLQFSPDL